MLTASQNKSEMLKEQGATLFTLICKSKSYTRRGQVK